MVQPERSMETETGWWFVLLLWFLLERFISISSGCTCYPTFSSPGRNMKSFLKLNLCLLWITFWSQQLICFQINEPILFRVCGLSVYCERIIKKGERIKSEPGFYAQINDSCLSVWLPVGSISCSRQCHTCSNKADQPSPRSVSHNLLRL